MLHRDYRLPIGQKKLPLYSYSSPYFIVKVFASDHPHPRFGFVVSKKIALEAVKRNRIKRRLRSVIEALLPQIKGGYDILFIVQRGGAEATYPDFEAEVSALLNKKALRL